MKVVVKLASPKNAKEQMFQLEELLENEITNPSVGYVIIGGKEYKIEVYHR
jgi:hypothetical protein